MQLKPNYKDIEFNVSIVRFACLYSVFDGKYYNLYLKSLASKIGIEKEMFFSIMIININETSMK